MQSTINIPVLGNLDSKQLGIALNVLGQYAIKSVQQRLAEVYAINVPKLISGERNYIPLRDLQSAVSVTINKTKWSLTIFIKEDLISFEDSRGQPIYPIDAAVKERVEIIDTLQDYWQLPIQGKREDQYYISRAMDDIVKYINKDFTNYVQKLALKGGKPANGKR